MLNIGLCVNLLVFALGFIVAKTNFFEKLLRLFADISFYQQVMLNSQINPFRVQESCWEGLDLYLQVISY